MMGEYVLFDGVIQQERPVYQHVSRGSIYLYLSAVGLWKIGSDHGDANAWLHSNSTQKWRACPTEVMTWSTFLDSEWVDAATMNVTCTAGKYLLPSIRLHPTTVRATTLFTCSLTSTILRAPPPPRPSPCTST